MASATGIASPQMEADSPSPGASVYLVREAVAVFPDADALEAAVNDLQIAGFNRAGISVLGSAASVRERIGHLYRSVGEIEDDGHAPRSAFVSRGSRLEAEAAAITLPLFIGGLAGAAAVAAWGGALIVAIGAIFVGSAVGTGLGALLARAVARQHAHRVEQQLAQGGLVLWVCVVDQDAERRALAVLEKAGGRDIHVHEIQREWGPKDRPFSETQVDPLLLERDPPF